MAELALETRPGPVRRHGICAVRPDGQIKCLSEAPPRQTYRTPGIFHTGHWTKQAFGGSARQWRKERLFPKTTHGELKGKPGQSLFASRKNSRWVGELKDQSIRPPEESRTPSILVDQDVNDQEIGYKITRKRWGERTVQICKGIRYIDEKDMNTP